MKILDCIKKKECAIADHATTGAWNYTIDYNNNFIGLIYRHFIDYVNVMLDGLGYIPTYAWCNKPLNPTSQQLRLKRNGYNIYCQEVPEESYNSCKKQGRISKQNEKRRTTKKEFLSFLLEKANHICVPPNC